MSDLEGLTKSQWIAVRDHLAHTLHVGEGSATPKDRARAERLMNGGYIDLAKLLRTLSALPQLRELVDKK